MEISLCKSPYSDRARKKDRPEKTFLGHFSYCTDFRNSRSLCHITWTIILYNVDQNLWSQSVFTKGSSFYHASKIFRKTYISYPLIRISTCAYQGARNVFGKTLRTYYMDNANNYWQESFGKLTAFCCSNEGNKEVSAKG